MTLDRGLIIALGVQGRNRRCITVDLHKEEGRDIVRRLADRADVLVENFRPGVMEKWGLGPKVECSTLDCGPETYRRFKLYIETALQF